MVQAGRVACIFTPFALSIATLVCLILIFLGGTREKSNALGDLYFFEADLSSFANATSNELLDIIDISSTLNNLNLAKRDTDSELTSLLAEAQKDLKIKDFYTIYLWNYCSWNGDEKYSYCSPGKAEFWFNPIDVWGLNDTAGIETLIPTDLKDALKTYQTVSKYMFVVYVIALVATAVELLIGISAIFSRWGSFFTTFFAVVAFLANLAASIIATVLFSVLETAFNKEFKSLNITSSMGKAIFRTTWLAVVFSGIAAFFWFFSICCCSGRSPYKGRQDNNRRVKVEKTPYTYERVGSPYLGPQGGQDVPLTNMGPSRQSAYLGPQPRNTAYEPFRPQQV